ncbi:leucyl aminopeptidase [Lysobacter sp. D1-1-M9]|uniref:leucyl aminopeptidase n=1 Tax=Novilysobacter longmucuonensis TaxID=3098603 RepID=UPI002FCC45AE
MSRFLSVVAALALPLAAADAAAERRISFAPYALPGSGTVALAVREGVPGEGAFAQLNAASNGALRRAVDAMQFEGKRGSKLDLPGLAGYDRVILLGIGEEPVTPRVLEDLGGRVGQEGAASASPRIELLWVGEEADAAAHLAFGAALGQYRFDKYKSRDAEDDTAARGEGELVVRTPAGVAAGEVYRAQWQPVATAVKTARDLVTEPANVLYPEVFVERAREAFDGMPNVRIEVLDVPAMEKLGMGGMLAVGKGSARPPRLLVVHYTGGARDQAPLAFVGKGITFDTGGISIKGSSGLWRMKYDMAGAASVTSAVLALAGRRAPVNAVAVAALAENMPSGTAAHPGDVVTTMSGKTFEIMSTDAEGRMVLSDAVYYAQQEFEPKLLVDVATLTGSIVTALGDEYAGLFSRDDTLAAQLTAAGELAGEDLWRMPLHESYGEGLKSPVADLRNGGGGPGAGVGAHFIGNWIADDLPWAHLDIAGMAWRESEGTPTSPTGATAFGVRLLDRFVREYHQ